MKTIQLKSIKISHFKGIASLESNFGTTTSISGANGTGKSSVYDAYLWCLFGKDYSGSTLEVRTLNKDNQPLHKVVTEVEMVLNVDGTDIKVCRREKEKWVVARGTATEEYKGQEQEFCVNDVPYTKRDFIEKLNSICNVDDWFMLSSISAFMNLKMEVRRQRLQKLTDQVSDEVIAADYPHVLKAVQEGKSVDELKRQNKASKDSAKELLDQIPIRIDQQEKMRVNIDVDAVKKEKEELEGQKSEIEKELADLRTQKPGAIAEGIEKELAGINSDMSTIEVAARKKIAENEAAFNASLNALNNQIMTCTSEISMRENNIPRIKRDIASTEETIRQREEKWSEVSKKAYNGNVDETCPLCGQALPADKVQEMKNAAIAKFNEELVAEKNSLISEIRSLNETKESLEGQLKVEESNIAMLKSNLSELENKKASAKPSGSTFEQILASNDKYQELVHKRGELNAKREELAIGLTDANREYQDRYNAAFLRLREVEAKIAEVNRSLYAAETNGRIDNEIARLNEQSESTAQVLAECENVEFEIMQFKKRKITLVEQSVSSLFEIVRWKMYESNVTNDGEKELCEALIDGVPYDSVNTATKYNAGIDIINGLSKAMGLYVPLFVDNAESVTNLRPALSQLITLTVVAGQELTIR